MPSHFSAVLSSLYSSYHLSFFDACGPGCDFCYDSWSGFGYETGGCVFCDWLSCRATSIVTVTVRSETLNEKGSGNGCASGTSSQNALEPAHQISILSETLTAAHGDLRLSTSTSNGTSTSISSPGPSASVLCFCEPDTPCARPLGWGDMSPYGSDDCGGASGSVGVSAHGRLRGDQETFWRVHDPRPCGAGGRGPCSSWGRLGKNSRERLSDAMSTPDRKSVV